MFFKGIIAGLFFLLNPPPAGPAPQAPNGPGRSLSQEEYAQYEAESFNCNQSEDPVGCQAAVNRKYGQ